jgi:transposase
MIELIEAGSSRREAAELFGISPSVVVIWAQRWKQTGSICGGSISPLEEHAEFLLDLIVEQPDLTLDEVVVAMSKAGIVGSVLRTTRHQLQKNAVCGGAEARGCRARTSAVDARTRPV